MATFRLYSAFTIVYYNSIVHFIIILIVKINNRACVIKARCFAAEYVNLYLLAYIWKLYLQLYVV